MLYCYNCFQEHNDPGPCPRCGYDPAQDVGKFPQALPHGAILAGQFITGRVLGQGGFGITYLALDNRSGDRVALKEFLPDTMAGRAAGSLTVTAYSGDRGQQFQYGLDCFLDEAKTLAKFIGNPNIVGVRSYFQENGTAYFTMDYIEGVSLKALLRERGGRIDWEEAVRLLLPVMDALEAVHRENLVHRDVTPDNIYISRDGQVKLLDFGAARYSLGDRSRSLDVVLKPGYAPKEQYTRRGRQGAYTDVYSLGACFYASITGTVPPEALDRMEEDDLVPPSTRGIKIPEELEDAILKALEVQAGDRYQTMAAFRAGIPLHEPEPQPQPEPVPPPPPEPEPTPEPEPEPIPEPVPEPEPGPVPPSPEPEPAPKSRPTVWMLAAAALALVLIVFGATRLFHQDTAPTPTPALNGSGGSGGQEEVVPVIHPGLPEEEPDSQEPDNQEPDSQEPDSQEPDGQEPDSQEPDSQEPDSQEPDNQRPDNQEPDAQAPDPQPAPAEPEPKQETPAQPQEDPRKITYNGNDYEGDTKDGVPHGTGTMIYKTDDSSTGGEIYAKGDKYTGEWKNGKRDGQGTVWLADGTTYKGQWKNDLIKGQGTETNVDGYTITGEFKESRPHGMSNGQLTVTFDDGTKYSGQIVEGELQGQGTFTSPDGVKYTGAFKGSNFNGQGTMTWADGDKYVGNYKDGERSGQGTYTWADGSYYKGEWKNNERNGQGTLYNADGSVELTGTWKDGELVSAEVSTVTNEPYTMVTSKFSVSGAYTGDWKDGKPHGKGTLSITQTDDRWDYGDTLWSADWVNGLIEGYGQWRSAVDGAYDGNFSKGLKSGYGKMWFSDGTIYDGQWSKGDFVG